MSALPSSTTVAHLGGTPGQIRVASAIAFGYTAFAGASASARVIEMFPEDSLVRKALQKYHEICASSPRMDVFRALSVAVSLTWRQSVIKQNVAIVDVLWGLTFVISAQVKLVRPPLQPEPLAPPPQLLPTHP